SDVERVALLARLDLSDAEIEALTPQLAGIVAYVDQLGEVDTGGVEPMAHAVEQTDVLRPDKVAPGLSQEAALANAPRHDEVGFRVPAVLGD
ncbi:MAG: Asp-tRNA(Asn)/Glu-tRNA(Gln) amidotransferase subunit GatC, partial [Planctomycetota bacterium]